MWSLCDGGDEPPSSLKAIREKLFQTQSTKFLTKTMSMRELLSVIGTVVEVSLKPNMSCMNSRKATLLLLDVCVLKVPVTMMGGECKNKGNTKKEKYWESKRNIRRKEGIKGKQGEDMENEGKTKTRGR
ncbi:hypothetical protein ANN_00386 [Periplaneta americana]|uniref:Uncharacterized protein n=1 Tax=Periplaneta americana TaxID=6978 RepID=A0ABQ8TQW3_PERAM|nr:hypothetical protein ANN_00386 [Periplaneta americana]